MLSWMKIKRLAVQYAVKLALADKYERRMRFAGSKSKRQHFKIKFRKYRKAAQDAAVDARDAHSNSQHEEKGNTAK